MYSYSTYQSSLDTKIFIAENGKAITHLVFSKEQLPKNAKLSDTNLLNQLATQLDEYFAGLRQTFTLPLEPEGTDFRKRVWGALTTIPYGETQSYKQIAEKIGNPKACRAVGGANHHNPISILIPCHRVIGASGAIVGYGGGVGLKEKLLILEQKTPK